MTSHVFLQAGLFGLASFLSAFAAFRIVARRREAAGARDRDAAAMVFLLEGTRLVDANFAGRRLFDAAPGNGCDLARLAEALRPTLPEPGRLLAPPAEEGDLELHSPDARFILRREVSGSRLRLTLAPVGGLPDAPLDIPLRAAMQRELETLRAHTESAPYLVWRTDAAGDVVWINRAYLALLESVKGRTGCLSWPLPKLFDATEIDASGARLSATVGADIRWFDCHVSSIGTDRIYTAFPADAVVRGEARRKEFTETLTRTFADLTVGLALFDRRRQLVLFNPALTDLLRLPAEFLLGRPTLFGFLDRLRDEGRMPEPRDFAEWRQSILALEEAAEDGTFIETWSLPGNATHRVTGRPHPDGAIALLFEDISAEMALTRRYRAEIARGQNVLDTMSEAVAVFAPDGTLATSNAAYDEMWSLSEETGLDGETALDAARLWQGATLPTPIWGDFRDFVEPGQDRGEWQAEVQHRDGRRLSCRFSPLPGGDTLAAFTISGRADTSKDDFLEVV